MLTYDQIRPYLEYADNNAMPKGLKHEFYDESIEYKDSLAEVFGKKYPKYLDNNRPREKAADRAYRKKIYKNKWEQLPDRISETLDYIHQADDFGISFPKPGSLIPDEFTLEKYTGSNLTPDGDLKEWFFNNAIAPYILDPNAATAMVLTDFPTADPTFYTNGFFNPKPMVFGCEHILMHQKGRFAVLISPEKRPYIDSDGIRREGRIIHFFDDESYTAAFEIDRISSSAQSRGSVEWAIIGMTQEVLVNENDEEELVSYFDPILHHFESMPVFKLGKKRAKVNAKREELYKSILDGAIPSIKEAQQIQNDIEAERTFHVTSQEWRRQSALPKCKHPGCVAGQVMTKDSSGNNTGMLPCPSCKGTGVNNTSGSPLDMLLVNDMPDPKGFAANETEVKTTGAPGGYIERSIEPIKQLTADNKIVGDDVYQIINMQFIRVTPNEASGTSKRYDREELYRELNTQAAHLINMLVRLFAICDHIRYSNQTYVGEQIPEIMVPVRFNLENAELTRAELNDAKDKKYDPALVSVLEMKLLEYNVGKTAVEYQQYETRLKLDPFRVWKNDEKNMITGLVMMMLPDGEQRTNMVGEIFFSILFDALMIKAQIKHEDFYSWELGKRHETLRGFLKDYYKEVRDIQTEIDPVTGLPKMAQYAIKPAINIQDTNQTDKAEFSTGAGFGK